MPLVLVVVLVVVAVSFEKYFWPHWRKQIDEFKQQRTKRKILWYKHNWYFKKLKITLTRTYPNAIKYQSCLPSREKHTLKKKTTCQTPASLEGPSGQWPHTVRGYHNDAEDKNGELLGMTANPPWFWSAINWVIDLLTLPLLFGNNFKHSWKCWFLKLNTI